MLTTIIAISLFAAQPVEMPKQPIETIQQVMLNEKTKFYDLDKKR